ncbi:hypothetical protein BKA66DRAFT_521340 [Pyrenochaeta sp. MPI-SDFR-AT-0127]|nr:hypothetical protein BKA66DRAFT_521340 [Pyrenochaeta sp. MPI-SDFR-AT-0127]
MNHLRDVFSRGENDKIRPDLRRALAALQLHDLDGLEERLLSTDAFLKPWAVFRDSILFLQPEVMPRATLLSTSGFKDGITRWELLWFYTQFDQDTRRSKYSHDYTSHSSDYCDIDKSQWHVQDYEKHLYSWLLQDFKVGKTHNPWGFDYLELRSICSAWEAIFVPIVNAVRASYSVKGRQHYGRLALFIESRYPSRLAFPEGNVTINEGISTSPTPFRIVSVPKKMSISDNVIFERPKVDLGMLTKRHYDETEKELRDVYPQYGGLVERPKFKHKMGEWLDEQRVRIAYRKAAETHGKNKSFQPQILHQNGEDNPFKKGPSADSTGREPSHDGTMSSIKRYSDSIRRSLSLGISNKANKQDSKSPKHVSTMHIYISDETTHTTASPVSTPARREREQTTSSLSSADTVITHRPWLEPLQRNSSEQITYTSIHNSNSSTKDFPLEESKEEQASSGTNGPMSSPTGQISAIPLPQHYENTDLVPEERRSVKPKRYCADVRAPSYEGNGYADEISLTNLHARRKYTAHTPELSYPAKSSTRIPGPIQHTGCAGQLHAADIWLPKAIPWPGFESDDEDVPVTSSKSLDGRNSTHIHVESYRPQQVVREDTDDIRRIVSKENIRAALARISRESLTKEQIPPVPKLQYTDGPLTIMKIGGSLQTYNTHMFPRKATPVGVFRAKNGRRPEGGGAS